VGEGGLLLPDGNAVGGGGDAMATMMATADLTGIVVVPSLPQNGDQNLQDDLAVSDDSEDDGGGGGDGGDERIYRNGGHEDDQQPPQPPPADGDDVMAF
jgi:hypothetical protein